MLARHRALGWNRDAMIATPIATGTTISSTAPSVTAMPSTTKAITAIRSVRPTKSTAARSHARLPVMTVVRPFRWMRGAWAWGTCRRAPCDRSCVSIYPRAWQHHVNSASCRLGVPGRALWPLGQCFRLVRRRLRMRVRSEQLNPPFHQCHELALRKLLTALVPAGLIHPDHVGWYSVLEPRGDGAGAKMLFILSSPSRGKSLNFSDRYASDLGHIPTPYWSGP